MNHSMRAVTVAVFLSLTAEAVTAQSPAPDHACSVGEVRISAAHPMGRLDGCERTGDDSFTLRFDPENLPINHSPWYAFQVSSDADREIVLTLTYSEHEHRYWPKLSRDGQHWQRAGSGAVSATEEGEVTLRLRVGPETLWVAGQEIIDNASNLAWMKTLEERYPLRLYPLGESTEGRDIHALESEPRKQSSIVLVGRQHPPEVTGAIALRHFVERIFEPDPLAKSFRGRVGLLLIPHMNPDGVAAGNWRHNSNGIDLNRDWGPFTQRETQLVRDGISRFAEPEDRELLLFLDFHSTQHDVLYTQTPELETTPADFTWRWIERLQAALTELAPGYPVRVRPGHNPDRPTSKAYMYGRFGIPAITFELGDETDRTFIRSYARAAAETMMQELLEVLEESGQ